MTLNLISTDERYKLTIITFLVTGAFLLAYYCHVILHTSTVFTQLFYIPIILAAIWWKRKGIAVALLLGALLILSNFIFKVDDSALSDYLRAFIFIVIATVVSLLSEKIAKAEAVTKRAYEELEQIFNTAGNGMCLIDRDFNILRINKTFEYLSDIRGEDAASKKCYEIFPGTFCHSTGCTLTRILSGEELVEHEVEKQRSDNTKLICIVTATPLRNHSGKLIGVVEDFKDITDRKKSEEKMQKLTYDLRVRVKELNCLYSLSKLVEKPGITLIEVLQGTVNLIPSAWQYSEITCACIIYVGHVYKTYNYKETIWKQACDIIAQKNQVGTVEVFYLEEKPERDEGPFLKEERDLIEIITGRLGRIVERIRAEEALKVAHDELERRVEERTIKLNQANVLLCQEIEDRKRTEEELKKSKMQLEFLSSQLINLQENERKQIAQELHDSVGQTLVSLKYRVEAVLKQMDKETGSSYTIPLKNLIPRVQDAINEVGRISKGLRPPMLDELGIIATFSWLCREFETIHTDIQIEQEIELQEDDVPETLKVVIYRILQEGLSNIVKHSGANLVHISFKKTDRTIELAIKDNGRGFNLKRALSLDNFNGGLGLINMRRRTENSGGSFEINSDKETGTCIRALWQCYG